MKRGQITRTEFKPHTLEAVKEAQIRRTARNLSRQERKIAAGGDYSIGNGKPRPPLTRKSPLKGNSVQPGENGSRGTQSPRKPIRVVGRRGREWRKVWNWLKPRLEAAGRTGCEFDFLEHDCGGPLDPAHSKKRAKMQDLDIYAVALGCRTIHDYLDGVHVYPPLGRRIDHTGMESAVMKAIERHGGLILPDAK